MSIEKRQYWCKSCRGNPSFRMSVPASPLEKRELHFGDGFAHAMGVQECEHLAVGFLLM